MFREAAVELASTAPPAMPAPGLRDRVLAAARSTPQEAASPRIAPLRQRAGRPALVWGLVAASAALALSHAWTWSTIQRLRRERDQAHSRIAALQSELESRPDYAAFIAPDAKQAVIAPSAAGRPDQLGWASLSPSGRGFAVFRNLTPPPGRDYELWALYGETPRSLGVLRADSDGTVRIFLDHVADAASVTALAVSLEPAGGSPETGPTGPVILVGAIGS
jgi:hypothetical protein